MFVWFSVPGDAQRGQFSQDEMKTWLTYIASDALQGRQAFTEGLGLAGAYIADQLRTWGVAPAGDAGYVLPDGQRARDADPQQLERDRDRERSDAHLQRRRRRDVSAQPGWEAVDHAGVEFVGYGLQLKAINHDDYASREHERKDRAVSSGGASAE